MYIKAIKKGKSKNTKQFGKKYQTALALNSY